jgi:hypothetical protein
MLVSASHISCHGVSPIPTESLLKLENSCVCFLTVILVPRCVTTDHVIILVSIVVSQVMLLTGSGAGSDQCSDQ